MVNYHTIHNEVVHKYFFKAFYNTTIKKEYKLQIHQYNVCHPNIVVMKDVIWIAEKSGELLVIENVDKISIAEVV